MTPTKAEELSDWLFAFASGKAESIMLCRAAEELRGLSAVEAERDALKQTLHDELAENLRLRELGGAKADEGMTVFLERVFGERDALRADAERYRWLVARPLNGDDEFYISAQDSKQANADGWWALGGDMSKSEADDYIDAAMKGTT